MQLDENLVTALFSTKRRDIRKYLNEFIADIQELIGESGSQTLTAPTDISGCGLWLDASTLDLADNDPVETWPDGSGNGYDAEGAPASPRNSIWRIEISYDNELGQYTLQAAGSEVPNLAPDLDEPGLQLAFDAASVPVTVTLISHTVGPVSTFVYEIEFIDALGAMPVALLLTDDVQGYIDRLAQQQSGSAGGGQATFKAETQNGLGVVRFDPGEAVQFLTLSGDGLDLVRGIDGVTVAMVAKANANSTTFCASGGQDNLNERLQCDMTYQKVFMQACSDDASDQLDTASMQGRDVANPNPLYRAWLGVADMVGQWIGCDISAPAGVPQTSNFSDPAVPFPDTASVAITIGSTGDQATGFDGDIAELLVYQRVLTATERRQLLEYLSAKWATL